MKNLLISFLCGIGLCLIVGSTNKSNTAIEVKPAKPLSIITKRFHGYYNDDNMADAQKFINTNFKNGYILKTISSTSTGHNIIGSVLVVMEKY